jgi:neutral ceramidase
MAITLLLSMVACRVVGAAEFRAGAAVGDITPTKWPVFLVGSFGERPAEKAWDPLSARALVLDDGTTKLAIVVVDSCLIPRVLFDKAKAIASKATGIRQDHMLMAATHSHSAPASLDRPVAKASEHYLKVLVDGIVQAIEQANSNLEPATMGSGQVDVPEHVHNRRWYMKPGGIVSNPFGETTDQVRMNPPSSLIDRPAGPVDSQVSIVSIRSKVGAPIALLANYSLHYVGGVPAGGVSADYFGEFAKQIKQRIVPKGDEGRAPFVGIMSNGTSGDVNNINFRNRQPGKKPFEQIRYVASSLAEEVLQVAERIEHREEISLAMAQRELTLNLRRPTVEQLAQAKRFLAETDDSKLPRLAKAYAGYTNEVANMPPSEEIILQAIRIGDLGIVSIPCEVFAETGLAIKAGSPLKATITMELANGWNRYLPTPRQHRLGGYETWLGTNILEINASVKIEQTLLDLLSEVALHNAK